MSRIVHRSSYSFEKVLEEVQEARSREQEIHSFLTTTTTSPTTMASKRRDFKTPVNAKEEEPNQLEFCPGIVHLLKDKFSQLSRDSQPTRFGSPLKSQQGQPRSRSISNLFTAASQSDVVSTTSKNTEYTAHYMGSLNRERSRQNFRKSSENVLSNQDRLISRPLVSGERNLSSTTSSEDGSKVSIETNSKLVGDRSRERGDISPPLFKSEIHNDIEELEELPIKNIVSATRSIFECLTVNSTPSLSQHQLLKQPSSSKKESIEGYLPSNRRGSGGDLISRAGNSPHTMQLTESAMIKSSPSSQPHYVNNSVNSSLALRRPSIDSSSSSSFVSKHRGGSSHYFSNTANGTSTTVGQTVVKNSNNGPSISTPTSMHVVDTSPANEYIPLARVAATRKSFQAAVEDSSRPSPAFHKSSKEESTSYPKSPMIYNSTSVLESRSVGLKPHSGNLKQALVDTSPIIVSSINDRVNNTRQTNDKTSAQQAWDNIPAPPRRKTFIDEAKHVSISAEELSSSRKFGKSWIFSTDVKSISTNGSVAIEVKPSTTTTSEPSSTSECKMTAERLAQQTFWDSYRTEDAKGHAPSSELIAEARELMANSREEEEDSDLDALDGEIQLVESSGINTTKSNIRREQANKKSQRLCFAEDTQLTTVFEYQSEQSFLKEIGQADYYDSIPIPPADGDSDNEGSDVDADVITALEATSLDLSPPVKMSSYQSRLASDFAWGTSPAVKIKPVLQPSSQQLAGGDTENKGPLTTSNRSTFNEVSSWSTTARGEADLLF